MGLETEENRVHFRRAGWLSLAVALPALMLVSAGALLGRSELPSTGLRRPLVVERAPTTLSPDALLLSTSPSLFVDYDLADRTAKELPGLSPNRELNTTAALPPVTTPSTSTTTTTVTAGDVPGTTTTTTTTIVAAPASTTTTTTTTTLAPPPPSGALRLWDTAWQIAAKANQGAMQEYVDRIAAARGTGGQNLTGFWFSVVNINQDINTSNGHGHQFGSFDSPSTAYLDDVERLIEMAAQKGLRVGIVVAWDGPNQYAVEHGKLNLGNAYQYGNTLAARWTRPDFGGRTAIDSWIMGGDTTDDCCGGEHGEVWAEVVRGIKDAQAANGFSGPRILLHTAPGQHMNYLGAPWLDAHAPQTGHCADANTAVQWMQQLTNAGATIWGNGEMRYEEITWSCNGNSPISPQQVLDDVIAMKNLGTMGNFAYGFDPRWNASNPGSVGLSASGPSAGLQLILDEPGLIRPR